MILDQHRCESGNSTFAWRVTWIYVNSPFNQWIIDQGGGFNVSSPQAQNTSQENYIKVILTTSWSDRRCP